MYLEYLFVLRDYFKVVDSRTFLFEWVTPLIITVLLAILNIDFDTKIFTSFTSNSISILGILLGFSIAVITILSTGNGANIDEIKNYKTKYGISLYNLLLTNFTYSIVMEILVIISALILPLFFKLTSSFGFFKVICIYIFVFTVIHILFLNLRNLTDFYFCISKKSDKKQILPQVEKES